MPTYLCHGFRWTRKEIRSFVVLQNIDDAAPDWIIGRRTSKALLERFGKKFDFLPQRRIPPKSPCDHQQQQQSPPPKEKKSIHQDDDFTVPPSRIPDSEDNVLTNDWSPVKLLEEYDPEETSVSARPFAYVADYAIRTDLSADISEEMTKYAALVKERNEGDWFEKLRDKLQEGAPIGWYVVVNGDEERAAPDVPQDDDEAVDVDYDGEEEPTTERLTATRTTQGASQPRSLRHKISRAGLRRLFGKKYPPGSE